MKKFWSQGTLLGSMGSGSQKALTQGACQDQIPLTWSPWGPPELVAAQAQAKTLKTVGAWCDMQNYSVPTI